MVGLVGIALGCDQLRRAAQQGEAKLLAALGVGEGELSGRTVQRSPADVDQMPIAQALRRRSVLHLAELDRSVSGLAVNMQGVVILVLVGGRAPEEVHHHRIHHHHGPVELDARVDRVRLRPDCPKLLARVEKYQPAERGPFLGIADPHVFAVALGVLGDLIHGHRVVGDGVLGPLAMPLVAVAVVLHVRRHGPPVGVNDNRQLVRVRVGVGVLAEGDRHGGCVLLLALAQNGEAAAGQQCAGIGVRSVQPDAGVDRQVELAGRHLRRDEHQLQRVADLGLQPPPEHRRKLWIPVGPPGRRPIGRAAQAAAAVVADLGRRSVAEGAMAHRVEVGAEALGSSLLATAVGVHAGVVVQPLELRVPEVHAAVASRLQEPVVEQHADARVAQRPFVIDAVGQHRPRHLLDEAVADKSPGLVTVSV